MLNDDLLKALLKFSKLKGKVGFLNISDNELSSRLLLTGFININQDQARITCEKPNYEVGSMAKLSFSKKPAAAVWKLDVDDDDEMIDPDELLDEEDKVKPTSESLRVCGTTGKRKACKDCSCGLAEELDAEAKGTIDTNQTQKSSCGSVSGT